MKVSIYTTNHYVHITVSSSHDPAIAITQLVSLWRFRLASRVRNMVNSLKSIVEILENAVDEEKP